MIHYAGLFFEGESEKKIQELERNKLDKIHDKLHCTFKYEPVDENMFDELVGKEFNIYLIGYGSNEENSGFQILLPEELRKYYINQNGLAHITASINEDGKAVNTSKLKFEPLDKPIKVTGRFGYWIIEDDKEYLSYEKYNKGKSL